MLTPQYPSGILKTMTLVQLNSWYRFTDVIFSDNDVVRYYSDPMNMVMALSLSNLLQSFHYFTIRDFRVICRSHNVGCDRMVKTQMLACLERHICQSGQFLSLGYVDQPLLVSETYPRDSLVVHGQKTIDQGTHMEHPCERNDTSNVRTDHLAPVTRERMCRIICEWQNSVNPDALRHLVCASCSKRVMNDESEYVEGTSVDLRLLRNESLSESLLPDDYDLVVYKRAILNVKGLEDSRSLRKVRFCKRCLSSLRGGKMPKFALANSLYYGYRCLPVDVKMAFDESTLFDRMLVCRARCNSICCRFNLGDDGQDDRAAIDPSNVLKNTRKGIRGNVMVAPLNTIKMNKVLPPSSNVVKDTMCAVFLGKSLPSRDSVHIFRPVLVRKSRVKTMIAFLLSRNQHYQSDGGVTFSQSNLNGLFNGVADEGVPIVAEVGHIKVNEAIDGATSDYTPRNLGTVVDEDEDELLIENVGYTDGDCSPMNYREMKSVALERCLMGKPFIASGVGGQPIPDFYHPSVLTWLFPHLDPWGIGGFHHPGRKIRIGMEEQLCHLMMIDDSPFERDTEFAFVFHNVVRKATVSSSLRFRVPFKTHQRIVRDLLAVDLNVLKDMSNESKRDPYFKPVTESQKRLFKLLASLAMVAKHIPGSDGYKIARRNEIRGLILQSGTPTLFVTLNPADVDHPLVRLYADSDSVSDFVDWSVELGEWRRKLFAAKNPAACAMFFDKMITSFIRIILRYGREEPGIYGRCNAYYGMVEAQGKGTLHCHLLIWLDGHLSPQDTKIMMLSDNTYRDKMFRWLESVILCEFPVPDREFGNTIGMETQRGNLEQKVVRRGESHPGTLWGPSINVLGDTEAFWSEYYADLVRLLHNYNWHVHQATCWKYLSRGQPKTNKNCRVGMDGETREFTSLDPETASILLRRHHPWIASHTDLVTFLMRCNMDIKAVGSGEAAKAFLCYVTDYITKPCLPVHSGLSALTYAIDKLNSRSSGMDGSDAILNAAIVAVNSMMGRQEISHQQVMSYLVGGGDHYTSSKFSVLNWGAIVSYCDQFYLQLTIHSLDCTWDDEMPVSLSFGNRAIMVSSQQLDYRYRSEACEFEAMCLYDFIAYIDKAKLGKGTAGKRLSGSFSDHRHPQFSTHYLWVRKEVRVPVLLGPSIPHPLRSAAAEEQWAKAVLLLFVPWRNLLDMRSIDESWMSAYNRQCHLISSRSRTIVANINVLNECKEARDVYAAELASARVNGTKISVDVGPMNSSEPMREQLAQTGWADVVETDMGEFAFEDDDECEYDNVNRFTTDGGEVCRQTDPFDILFEEGFMSAFSACNPVIVATEYDMSGGADVVRVNAEDNAEFTRLASIVESSKRKRCSDGESDPELVRRSIKRVKYDENTPIAERAVLSRISWWDGCAKDQNVVEDVINDMHLETNPEQLRAFGIVARHVVASQSNQLMLYIGGVGGTGKSHLINAIVMLFSRLGRRGELLLGAPTGIAAVLIGGSTLHSLVMVTPNGASTDLASLGAIWKDVRYLIIDEISMVGAVFLEQLSRRIRQAKAAVGLPADAPFAGVHMIFTGDFGQLKPPGQYALYSNGLIRDPSYTESRDKSGISAMNGVILWRQVRSVVKLRKNQRHSGDEQYGAFLERLRVGCCRGYRSDGDDLAYVRTRLLKNAVARGKDLTCFWDAPIIVGWKSLRDPLNETLVRYHASRLGQSVYNYHSEDLVHGSRLQPHLRDILWSLTSTENGDLFGRLVLFPGMKVMVTENISLSLGVVNGMEGVVRKVQYDLDSDGRRYAVLVYLYIEDSDIHIEGLPDGVIPIFPISKRISYVRLAEFGLKVKSFMRTQVPLIPAYAYTDFKSQGRTLIRVRVDLQSARGQGVYVMLSRVKSLSGLLILRDFSASRLYQRPSEELRNELMRLDNLDEITSSIYP